MSQAQRAQQSNRTDDGKYTTKAHSEADVSLGDDFQEAIEVDDGDSYDITPPSDAFDRVVIANSDGYVVEGTIYENFDHCLPADIDRMRETYGDDQITEYLNDRSDVIMGAINERYKNVQLDPGPDDTFALEFYAQLDGPVTEEDAAHTLWEESDGVQFANEIDPGTFGSEDFSSTIRDKLAEHDATKLPNPETIDEQAKQRFVDDFVSTAVQDAKMTAEEEYFMETEEEASDFEVDDESLNKLKTMAGEFYVANAGDLEAWRKDVSERKEYMNDGVGGHDAYMEAAGLGVGYRDRVPGNELEPSIMAKRLSGSASEEISGLENGIYREGKTIHFEGI